MASIRKHRNKWQVQIRIKGTKPVTKSFQKKSDATAWARITESEITRGVFVDPRKAEAITFADAIDRHIQEHPNPDSTRISRCKRLRSHLGRFSLAKLSTQQLAEYRNQRLEVASPMTVIHELALLNRILVLATTEWGICLPGGIPRVQMPKRPQGRNRRLSADEERRLLDALASEPEVRDIVTVATETAMRRSEILRIRKCDFDPDKSVLRIPVTKTGFERTIPVSARASKVLAERAESTTDALFKLKPSRLHTAFRKACRNAGMADLRFHDLRHEATSRFFERGLNVMEVASITGHRTMDMLSRYTHLRAEDLTKRI